MVLILTVGRSKWLVSFWAFTRGLVSAVVAVRRPFVRLRRRVVGRAAKFPLAARRNTFLPGSGRCPVRLSIPAYGGPFRVLVPRRMLIYLIPYTLILLQNDAFPTRSRRLNDHTSRDRLSTTLSTYPQTV